MPSAPRSAAARAASASTTSTMTEMPSPPEIASLKRRMLLKTGNRMPLGSGADPRAAGTVGPIRRSMLVAEPAAGGDLILEGVHLVLVSDVVRLLAS